MNNKKIPTSIGTIVLIIIAVTVFGGVWKYEKNQSTDETQINQPLQKTTKWQIAKPGIVGGPCEYDKVPGTCKILYISEDNTAGFTFASTGAVPANPLTKSLDGEHRDRLDILDEKDLITFRVGDKIDCEANLETKGTCTPVIFKFIGSSDKSMNGRQTYTNEKYGFSFQYPAEYVLTEKENKITILTKESYDFRTRTGVDYYPEDIIINIKPAAKNFSLGNNLINFAGDKAAESISRTSGDSGDVSTYHSFTTVRNGFIYDITFNNQPDLSDINKKILSTFKFTK